MSLTKWAEKEIATACKRENPNWDGKSFDYGCSCYQSALKAYKSLLGDGHSGYSFGATKNILIKLLNEIPLSPIEDKDFFDDDSETKDTFWDEEYLAKKGWKSHKQCPRRYSLFRTETVDGQIIYSDNDRAYCVNDEDHGDTFSSSITNIIDEMFPITMPYTPPIGKYKVYVKNFLWNKDNGDFDHEGIMRIETPDGQIINDLDEFYYFGPNGKEKIDRKTFNDRLEQRIDRINVRAAGKIYAMLIDHLFEDKYWNIHSEEWKRNHNHDELFNQVDKTITDDMYTTLESKCNIFYWVGGALNNFNVRWALVKGEDLKKYHGADIEEAERKTLLPIHKDLLDLQTYVQTLGEVINKKIQEFDD